MAGKGTQIINTLAINYRHALKIMGNYDFFTEFSYKVNEKALKCKPSANSVPLIDGLGNSCVVSRL